MSHRLAKKIRQGVLPNTKEELGLSRGRAIRGATEYVTVTPFHKDLLDRNPHQRQVLHLKPNCARSYIQRIKRNVGKV